MPSIPNLLRPSSSSPLKRRRITQRNKVIDRSASAQKQERRRSEHRKKKLNVAIERRYALNRRLTARRIHAEKDDSGDTVGSVINTTA